MQERDSSRSTVATAVMLLTNQVKITPFSYPFHGVGYCDFEQGGEVGNPRAAGSPKYGKLGQENMQRAPLGRQCQQLAIICPGQGAQPWNDWQNKGSKTSNVVAGKQAFSHKLQRPKNLQVLSFIVKSVQNKIWPWTGMWTWPSIHSVVAQRERM